MEVLLERIEEIIKNNYNANEKAQNGTIFERDQVAEDLTELIRTFDLTPSDWKKYVHYDTMKYTRNLIALGKEDQFGLMILAWGPGQQSPIHDHDGSHCIMRVLEGRVMETLYHDRRARASGSDSDSDSSFTLDTEGSVYDKTRESVLETGQTAYIHDRIGWHRVSNDSASLPAVSLHLYAPPIKKCQTYCQVQEKVRAQATCPYYSINGQVVNIKEQ